MNKYAQVLSEVLMTSYVYYHLDENLISDTEYDEKCTWLKSQKRVRLKNGLDKLINWKQFKTSTSLYYIREDQYPEGLKRIALKWLKLGDIHERS